VLKTPTSANGCGRTDAGLHASQYFFHADLVETAVAELRFKLNRTPPPDITVFDIIPVHDRANDRFLPRVVFPLLPSTFTQCAYHRSKDELASVSAHVF
jgi:tRNA U38,U39,U40 pseudouridine synthase TruA